MRIICSVIFLVLALSHVSGQKLESRLISTLPDPAPTLPLNTVAFFTFESQNAMVCVGCALNHQWIVTTATCAELYYQTGLRYILSKTNAISAVVTDPTLFSTAIPVKRAVVHPSFSRINLANDIALIQTNEIMPIDKQYILPNTIPKSWLGTPVTLRGFKATATALNLGEATGLTIASPALCERHTPGFTAKKLCTYSESMTCRGDQGSPLVITGTEQLLGLVSTEATYGNLCGRVPTMAPITYVNILDYRAWIRKVVEDPKL